MCQRCGCKAAKEHHRPRDPVAEAPPQQPDSTREPTSDITNIQKDGSSLPFRRAVQSYRGHWEAREDAPAQDSPRESDGIRASSEWGELQQL